MESYRLTSFASRQLLGNGSHTAIYLYTYVCISLISIPRAHYFYNLVDKYRLNVCLCTQIGFNTVFKICVSLVCISNLVKSVSYPENLFQLHLFVRPVNAYTSALFVGLLDRRHTRISLVVL